MAVEQNAKCLFCLDKIISYSLSSGQDGENDNGKETSSNPPNFRTLCRFLNLLITEDKLERLKSYADDDKTCDSFLCLGCFELVDKLRKLNVELERIKEEICSTTCKIRSVIVNQKDSLSTATAGVSNEVPRKRKSGRPKKDECRGSEKEGGFFRMFQELVRESVDPSIIVTSQSINQGKLVDSTENSCRKSKMARKTERPAGGKKGVRTDNIPEGHNDQNRVMNGETDIKIEVHHYSEEVVEEEEYTFNADFESDPEFPDTKQDLGEWEAAAESEEEGIKAGVEDEARKLSGLKRRKRPTAPNDDLDDLSGKSPTKRKRKTKSKPASHQQFVCGLCDASFIHRPDYVAHRKNHKKSLPINKVYEEKDGKRIEIWLCPLCDHKENGRQLCRFMEHVLSHENSVATDSSELHHCDKCEEAFSLKLNLDLHKISRHDRRHILLKCEFCENTSCKTQEEFITHLKTHLSDDTTVHVCKSCAMACSTLDKVLDHMRKHSTSKRLICPECPNEFPGIKDVAEHCFEAHPEFKEQFPCSHCTKSFLMEISLRVHLKHSHNIGDDSCGQLLSCSKCNNGKLYKSKIYLDRHMINMHGDSESRPHKCPHCEKSFRFQSLLQSHVDDKHKKIRYPCPHCPSSYTERYQLTYHMRTHTGEGLFTCEECGKQFPRRNQLKVHLITHQEKDPETKFVCEICGSEFANLLYLRGHKRNTHKEKKLECEYCSKKFGRKDHLKTHLRTHTGDRPYVCPVCQKAFNRRDILFVHMKMHGFSQEEAAKAYDNHVNDKLKQDSGD